jgi:hypothetical protein
MHESGENLRTRITTHGHLSEGTRRRPVAVRLLWIGLLGAAACVDHDVSGPAASGAPMASLSAVTQQVLQSGIDCGCNKVGAYSDPIPGKTIASTREGTSPGNVYQLTPTPIGNTTNLRINRGQTIVAQFIVPSTANWGFSPDDHRFVYHYVTGTAPNQTHNVYVYNLAVSGAPLVKSFQTATGGSQIVFSPKGKYLFYSWLNGSTNTSLTIVDAVTGALRYQTAFTFQVVPGNPGNSFGMASWGFSPDANERTFVYRYVNGQTSAMWNIVNLSRSSGSALVKSESAPSGFWRFSPCGDMLGVARQTSPSQQWVFLRRTEDGTVAGTGRSLPLGNTGFASTLVDHFVTLNGANQLPALAPNSADDSCQAPAPTLSGLSLNPSTRQGGGTSTGTVTLSGPAPTGGIAVTLSSSNTSSATTPPNVTIASGSSSATFTVQTNQVTTTTALTISAVAGGITKTATLTLTPPPAPVRAISVNPTSLSFGNQVLGSSSAPQVVTVSNTGNLAVTISSILTTGDFARTTNCPVSPASFAVGTSCSIWVTFTPTATGPRSGTLTITSDANGSPHVVTLSGNGYVATPGVTLSSTSINFGGVKLGLTPSRRTLTVTSSGTAPLVIASATLGGPNAWDFLIDSDSCSGAMLNPGSSCTVVMLFDPFNLGTRNATLTVAHNAAGSPGVVALTGVGLSPGPVNP